MTQDVSWQPDFVDAMRELWRVCDDARITGIPDPVIGRARAQRLITAESAGSAWAAAARWLRWAKGRGETDPFDHRVTERVAELVEGANPFTAKQESPHNIGVAARKNLRVAARLLLTLAPRRPAVRRLAVQLGAAIYQMLAAQAERRIDSHPDVDLAGSKKY